MEVELSADKIAVRERNAARYAVTSATNALTVLDMFAERKYISLNDVKQELGVSSATAYRLLASLEAAGFSERVPRKGYRAGAKALRWAANLLANLDTRVVARPVMRRITTLPGEAVYLAILRESALVVVEITHVGSATPSVLESLREDMRVQIHATALGRAVAAHLEPGRLSGLLGPEPYEQVTDRTPTSWHALSARLDEVRTRGYAVSRNEANQGISAVASAIFSNRDVIGSLSVTAPSEQFDEARALAASGIVKHAADRISHLVSTD
jgi:DNA-binding IclR family transcriptional regulator